VDATTISFGAVVLNHATTQVVTLTSVGKAAVTVKSASVQGVGFTLSPVSLPATLNPGQTLLLTVVFDPTQTGSATGKLTIASDSATNSTVTVSLTGTSTPHKVELNWGAPAASISQYKVYRATGTGTFKNLATTGQTTYTDTTVQSGQKYEYYVTSVESGGGESKPSNTTTVTIP
jgi:predicted phage tail protein